MSSKQSTTTRDTVKEDQNLILGEDQKQTENSTVERKQKIFTDLIRIQEGICNLYHDPCPLCIQTKKAATAIQSLILLIYHIPNALTEDELVPNRNKYYRLRDAAMNVFHRLWEPYLNTPGRQTTMPKIIDTILTNNVTDMLHETPYFLNLTDQISAFFQNRSPKNLNELRCWLLVARCMGDNSIPEVADSTQARKGKHLKYLTAQTRIKISRPNYLYSHHEKIQGMSWYTEDRMIDLIKWSTPTMDYNTAKHEAVRITLYPITATPHDFNEPSKYLMGKDTARQKSLFQMTMRQNLDCLICLGPNIRAFDISNIQQNQATDLLQSLEYALLGC